MAKPLVSLIIPTYNRPELLSTCLKSIYNQGGDQVIEVIVIDNHPSKSAQEVVSDHKSKNTHYFFESRQGHSFAKNKGLQKAKGEYSIFLDDDAKLPPKWLSEATKLITKRNFEVFGGPIKPYFAHSLPNWYKKTYETRTFGSKSRALNNFEFLPTSSTLIRTDRLKSIGGFNTQYGIKGETRRFGEDTDALRNLRDENNKIVIYYSPKLAVEHFTPKKKTTIWHIINHHFNLGASDFAVSGDFISLPKAIAKTLVAVFSCVYGLVVAVFFRNKNNFPYWQNYVWEKVSPNFYWFGRTAKKIGFVK